MGEVFAAEMRGAEGFVKPVALKRIYPHLAGNPRHRELFVREAKLVAQLSHPSIVQVLELGTDADGLFMAMELVQGVTLGQLVRSSEDAGRALPLEVVLAIANDLLEGLAYAHSFVDASAKITGIVHADVSPHNIMVTPLGRAKVCDFGVAKLLRSSSYEATRRERWGKVRYMAPEQLENNQVDARTDVYAMAIVMLESLTGKPAFDGAPADIARAIMKGERPSIRDSLPGVPSEITAVLERACATDPDARFANGGSMLRALFKASSTQAIDEGRTRLQELVRAEMPAVMPDAASTGDATNPSADDATHVQTVVSAKTVVAPLLVPQSPEPTRRKMGPVVIAALVVMTLVVTAGVLVSTPSEPNAAVEVVAAPAAPAPIPEPPAPEPPPTPVPTPVVKPKQRVEKPAEPAPARLNINAIPWAYVSVDGKQLDKPTPIINYALPPGRHSVQLRAANGRSETVVLNVASGEVVRRVVRLE